jgi:citrate lyase beta subunit
MTTTRLDLARSLLFTPGNRPERFAKAEATAADGVIIDLEDAVGPADKDSARAEVTRWLKGRGAPSRGGFLTCLRINSIYTEAGLKDLLAVLGLARDQALPDALLLPKVESAVEVELVARHLCAGGARDLALVALIESGAGLEHAVAIARASPLLKALGFGGADLSAELRAAFAWEPLLMGRARLVQAASMAGIALLDVPYLDIADDAGLTAESLRVRAMGYSGKLAIHPRQVEAINTAFTPTAAEIEHAQGVAAAYAAAAGGVCTYRGKMVDEPVMNAARRTLARAGLS